MCHGHPGHARARAGCPWHGAGPAMPARLARSMAFFSVSPPLPLRLCRAVLRPIRIPVAIRSIALAALPRRFAERLRLSDVVPLLLPLYWGGYASPGSLSWPSPNDFVQIHPQRFILPRLPPPAARARPSIIFSTLGKPGPYRVLVKIIYPLHQQSFAENRQHVRVPIPQ